MTRRARASVVFAALAASACGAPNDGARAASPERTPAPTAPVYAVTLGVVQDGGLPHIGCKREECELARRDPTRRARVACLGIVDTEANARFLVDATPDLASQIESLNAGRSVPHARPVEGILLTHAHIGHYAGLAYLGREALGAKDVPVYATPKMAAFLRTNGPWSQLVALGNVTLHEIEPGGTLELTPRVKITALRVPHRDEFSDTVGFRIEGPRRSMLYVPDIDKWEKWDRNIEEETAKSDVALLDATFAEANEVGRAIEEIPHPLVSETIAKLRPHAGRVWLTHMNHTNRLLFDASARAAVVGAGFHVATDGETFPL